MTVTTVQKTTSKVEKEKQKEPPVVSKSPVDQGLVHKLSKNVEVFAGPLLSSIQNGYYLGVMNVVFNSQQWKDDFGDPAGFDMNILATGNGFGVLTGFILLKCYYLNAFERSSKTFGIGLGNLIVISGALIQATCSEYWTFFLARFLCGLGMVLSDTSASTMAGEVALSSQKDIVGMIYGGLWFLGVILGNYITFPATDSLCWRVPSAYQAIIPTVQLALLGLNKFVPSLKHLAYNGQLQECEKVIKQVHGVATEHEVAQLATEREKAVFESTSLKQLAVFKSSQWYTLCAIVVPVICIHFGLGIISTVLGEILENTHGLDAINQQILINSSLLLHNITTVLIKLRDPSISSANLAIRGLLITVPLVIASSFVYSKEHLELVTVVLATLVHITCMGIPGGYLSAWAPAYSSQKLSNIMGIMTNISFLYNGFVNPWSMPRDCWDCYRLVSLAIFMHIIGFGFVSYYYRNRSLYSIKH